MTETLAARWRRWWFGPSMPLNLGVARAIALGGILFSNYFTDFAAFGRISPDLWKPVSFFRPLPGPPPPEALAVLGIAFKVSLALGCVGLFTRASTGVAFLLSPILLGLWHNQGKIIHTNGMLVFILAVLALSRSGDAFSVDRLIARLRGAPPPQPSGEYTWPIRSAWIVLTCVFFPAGIAKLRASGLAWVTSDNLAAVLALASVERSPLPTLSVAIARQGWLCHALAAGVLLVELGYPLALVSRRARVAIVAGAIALLLGILFLMGPRFEALLLCHAFWVPWDRVLRRGPPLDGPVEQLDGHSIRGSLRR